MNPRMIHDRETAPDADCGGEVRAFATRAVDPAQTEAYLRGCLAEFDRVRMNATGSCMRPVIAPGDTIELVSTLKRPPVMGDIVLARQPGGLRLHRLVLGPPLIGARRPWRTAADHGALDEPMSARDVLATVVSVESGRHVNDKPRRGWMLAAVHALLRETRLRLREALGRPFRT